MIHIIGEGIMIDAVFTWVNGQDPTHQKKRQAWESKTQDASLDSHACHETRFNNCDELYYSVQLARQNMPWLNRIFIITDQQHPSWLSASVQARLNVTIIDHQTIFVNDDQAFLPTFNSRSIELMLGKIPHLSDYFIYLNDDMFVVSPCQPSDFFDQGQPIFRGIWQGKQWLIKKMRQLITWDKGKIGLNGWHKNGTSGRFHAFRLAHAPVPIEKQLFNACFSTTFKKTHLQYRFRSKDQLWPIGYYAQTMLNQRRAKTCWDGYDCIDFSNRKGKQQDRFEKTLTHIKKRSDLSFLCVQSLDQATDNQMQQVQDYLHNLLVDPI